MDKERLLIEKLMDLDNARARVDSLRQKKQELIDYTIPDDVKEDLAGIDLEFDDPIRSAEEYARNTEQEIKRMAPDIGRSVDSEYLKAVYYKGRVSWDTEKLEGLALAFPQILECKKVGDPYFQIKNK